MGIGCDGQPGLATRLPSWHDARFAFTPSAMPASDSMNPLLAEWCTPYGLPPFELFRPEHFAEAMRSAMRSHLEELKELAAQAEPPSFDNTLAAFDRCGQMLSRVASVFYNLTASHTNAELQAVQREMAAPMAAHSSAIYMDAALFARVHSLHERRDRLGLTPEQTRLLQRVHLDFVREGALLSGSDQQRYAQIMQRLAQLTTAFGQNVLHDEAEFELPLRDADALAGLPASLLATARQAAADRGHAEGHVITLSRSLIVPFLTFSERRDLREQAWRAWVGRGEHDGPHDNRPVAVEILQLRAEQARLLGHASYADYALQDTMAGRQSAVQHLLDEVWPRALATVEGERRMLLEQREAAGHGGEGALQAWDWRHWAEKVRREHFDVDDAQVKPYFSLPNMVQAAFDCAQRLFGLRFTPRDDLPVYHPDVKAYEVRDAQGGVIALFMQDNHARASKRSGAWMSLLRSQSRNGVSGDDALPVVLNNNNFAKGADGAPPLLSLEEARTLFHEFGHGLHGMLSNVTYERLSCTQVLRDFVELPSQLFEHWLMEDRVLERHARHWHSDEVIPAELVSRLRRAQRFNQGYETVRYCASALLDMAVHALPHGEQPHDLARFEAQTLERMQAPAAVGLNHRLPHFQHLFSGYSYAAGYYVYLWAEVLDADAFEAFTEAGDPFDPKLAAALQRYIYGSGNSLEPGAAYAAFRGRPASVQPLLRKRGLLPEVAEA